MLQICCKNNNISKNFPIGSSLLDIYNGFNLDIPYGPVSAKVNNKVEGLNYRAYNNKDVEFLNILNPSGMRTYVRSLCFILCKAVEDLYPDGKIMLEHPVSKGDLGHIVRRSAAHAADPGNIVGPHMHIVACISYHSRLPCGTRGSVNTNQLFARNSKQPVRVIFFKI